MTGMSEPRPGTAVRGPPGALPIHSARCRDRCTVCPGTRGWRWFTTSCWICGAPSACSWSCAGCGPTPTSSPPSTTSGARRGRFAGRSVHSSFLQRLRPTARTFRALLPLYPAAIESFDLSGYDLVVSSSSAWAHAVLCDERHHARELLLQPVSLRVERPRADAGPPRPGHPRVPAPLVPALAPVGLDRGAANRSLRRELPDHPGADPRLLRARGRRSCIRPSTPRASPSGRWQTITRSSPS